ncbi:MAG: hypothetical protein AB7T63_17750 [Planctomycetota bacterium]
MPAANLLFQHTFDGAGYPDFNVVWPGFTFPASGDVNALGRTRPVVDGHGRGLPSRTIGGVTWRAKSTASPGRQAHRTALWAKWKNAGFAGRREVGIVVRYVDPKNCLVARLRSMGTANPELRLFKVVNGVATQLGPTYSGADVSATQLNAGVEWAVRVEDLAGGDDTKVEVYVGTQTTASRGTLRLSWTGDVGMLRGLHTSGVELHDQVYGDDVRVDNLACYDLADEWNPSGPPPAPGAGWQVEIGNTLYALDELSSMTPRIDLVRVTQGYGQKSNSATFRVSGDYRQTALLFPGQTVRVLHDGAVRFRGWVADGQLSADPTESQDWHCYDAHWNARLVTLLRPDKVGAYYYNVTDTESDEYDGELTGKTIGQVLRHQFEQNAALLRFYGCAPPTGDAFVSTELDLLDAEIPDVVASGQFPVMVDTLLRFMGHKFVVWVDPADLKWHFRDVTTLTGEDVSFTSEWVTFKVKPDRDKAYTRVEWRGTRKADAESVKLRLSDGSLKPVWTKEQEEKYGKTKRNKTLAVGKILLAGVGVAPDGFTRPYFDVPTGLFDQDDFRGATCTNDDGHLRLVVTHSSTRFWLSPPLWGGGTPPPAGSQYNLNLLSKDALAELSAQGVGRGFYYAGPTYICGYPSAASGLKINNLWQHGFCGRATAYTTGEDGIVHSEEYQYRVNVPNQMQRSAGWCDTTIKISEKPKPSIGLVNFLPPAGGSPPTSSCVPGNTNRPSQMPLVDIEIEVPVTEAEAAWFAEPPDVDDRPAFHGPAFSDDPAVWDGAGEPYDDDWRCTQTYIVDDPDFVDMEQEPGLRKAAKAILDVKSQKQYLFEVGIATPWKAAPPDAMQPASTSRWAGMSKRITLSSALRATQFEASSDLQVFKVTWDVLGNRTVLEAGTASGWMAFEGIDISKAFSEARVLKKAARMIKDVEDFRNCLLTKPEDRIGGVQKGPIDACDVTIINEQVRRVVSVEQDEADKVRNITHQGLRTWLDEELSIGPHADNPGANIAVPGRDGTAAKQAIDGPVLRSHANPDIPFQGPAVGNNGDRGRYGGQIVTNAALDGRPPREIFRRGGFAFRKREDGAMGYDGPPGVEYSALGADGAPTGPWTTFTSARSLPNQRAPLSMLGHGSTQHQLLGMARELARALGRVQDQVTEALLAPGDVGDGYPDGVPADLASFMRVAGAANPWLRPVPQSFEDPGGLVFQGPMNDLGADAEMLWRVRTPEMLLMRVSQVGPGGGTNGGSYVWDTSGPGGSTEFLASASVIHKQIDPVAMTADIRFPGAVTPTPALNPFGFDHEGMLLNATGMGLPAGAGGTLPIPPYARGRVGLWASFGEEASMGAPLPPGTTYQVQIDVAWKASPWGPPTPGAPQNVPVADGTGQGTALFLYPGGYVTPGLRKPSDIAVSAVYTPGGGTAPPNMGLNLLGIGVEVAVVEGGYALLTKESMEASEDWRTSHAQPVERFLAMDVWAMEVTKSLTESLQVTESWDLELNPGVVEFDALGLDEAWALDATKQIDESLQVAEAWDMVLNP